MKMPAFGQKMKAYLIGLLFVAQGLSPSFAIKYPYEAPKERRDVILSHLDSIKAGMSSKAVIERIGYPDEYTPLYEPKIKNPKQIGTTMWYIFSQRRKDGSEQEKNRVAVAIRLDSVAAVTRIDRINLPVH